MSADTALTGQTRREERSPADVLVGTRWLADHLEDPRVRVVEVDVNAKAFAEGHVDGAVLWNIYTDLKDSDYRPVDRPAIEHLVRASGIDAASIVVFYGYGPALGFWLMKLYGHREVRLLDASRDTWQAEHRPWTGRVATPAPTAYQLAEPDDTIRATRSGVERAIADPHCTLLDVRSDLEFRGERFWPSGGMEEGGRAGHVPGAAHVVADDLRDARGAFLPVEQLSAVYAPAELEANAEIIPYCTIGSRAATTWFVLTYLLGRHHVRVYDGSWAEWGRTPTTRVERG